jgi:hypothetical protein
VLEAATTERDEAVRRAGCSEDCAESWHADAMRLTEEVTAARGTVGLTARGEIVVMKSAVDAKGGRHAQG